MRQYQAIWEKIKKTGKAVIECDPGVFPRVKKAVIKEKCNDLGFKVLNDHDYFFLGISYDSKKKRATFVLRERYGLEGVKGI